MLPLSTSFTPHLAVPPSEPVPELEALLAEVIATARAAWPTIARADHEFLAYVAARVPAGAPLEHALRATCVADLYLACAIAHGDREAVRVFDAALLRDLGQAIAHLDGGTALIDDVRQAVRERVLAPVAAGKAKITEYAGRGDLRGWLRVVAVREALQLLRQRHREVPIDDGHLASLAVDGDGGFDYLDDRFRAVFRSAFGAALASLTPRERNLLRQHYLHGLTIDELAGLYRAHRATIARWIATTRARLLKRTRRAVGDALHVVGDELDSVMGRVGEQLDYSLRWTLSTDAEGEALASP